MVEPLETDRSARRLSFLAAILFAIGALTGGPLGLAKMGVLEANAGSLQAAHLNALLGSFWLLGLAFSLRYCQLGPGAHKALVVLCPLAAYSNWVVTVLKAMWQVSGLGWTDDAHNNIIAVLLNVLVVLPTLTGSAIWVWGLRPRTGGAADSAGT